MTTVLIVCVILLALAVAANAVLTGAIMRRLKAIEGRLPATDDGHARHPSALAPLRGASLGGRPGDPEAAGSATEAEESLGEPTTLAPGDPLDLPEEAAPVRSGEWLLAFTMPDCHGCTEDRPVLESVVRRRCASGQESAILVSGVAGEEAKYADLAEVATVLLDEIGEQSISERAGVRAFPAYAILRDGRLVRSAWSLWELGSAAPPRPA